MDRLTPCALVAVANAALDRRVTYQWRREGTEFVHHAGVFSHMDCLSRRSIWPLPQVANCEELARVAADKGILSVEQPKPGEIFLLWSRSARRLVHAGIVAWRTRDGTFRNSGRAYHDCIVIDSHNRRAGVRQRPLQLSPEGGDRFVRWVDLDGRSAWERASAGPGPGWERCVTSMRPAAPRIERAA